MGSFRTKSKPLAWVTKWIMVLFVDMERTEGGGFSGGRFCIFMIEILVRHPSGEVWVESCVYGFKARKGLT